MEYYEKGNGYYFASSFLELLSERKHGSYTVVKGDAKLPFVTKQKTSVQMAS